MSTLSGVQQLPRAPHTGRVTQARVVFSEWTKLRSLRSTLWSLLAAVLLTVAFPIIFAAVTSSHWGSMSPHERADRHPLDIALAGVNVSQLAIAVLGVLVVTGEYSTGMIRASFTAVPKRLPVLWAKTAVFAAVTLLLMVPPVLISFFASQAILSRHDLLQISFSDPGVARSVIRRVCGPPLPTVLLLTSLPVSAGDSVRSGAFSLRRKCPTAKNEIYYVKSVA